MNLNEQMNNAISWAERKRNIEQLRMYVRGYMQEKRISDQKTDLPWWLACVAFLGVIIGLLLIRSSLKKLENTGEFGLGAFMVGIILAFASAGITFFLYKQYQQMKCLRALSWLAAEENEAIKQYAPISGEIPGRYLDAETMSFMQDLVYTGRVTSLQAALDKADSYQAQRNISGDRYYYNRVTVVQDMNAVVKQCDAALGTTAMQVLLSEVKMPSIPKLKLPEKKVKHRHKSTKNKKNISKS